MTPSAGNFILSDEMLCPVLPNLPGLSFTSPSLVVSFNFPGLPQKYHDITCLIHLMMEEGELEERCIPFLVS